MAKRKSIRAMAEERYENPDIVEAVIQDANRNDTTARIERGELHLPTEHDATIWHERITNKDKFDSEQSYQRKRIDELEQRLSAFMSTLTPDRPPSKETQAQLQQIVREGQR